jgi:hypothetical protein
MYFTVVDPSVHTLYIDPVIPVTVDELTGNTVFLQGFAIVF